MAEVGNRAVHSAHLAMFPPANQASAEIQCNRLSSVVGPVAEESNMHDVQIIAAGLRGVELIVSDSPLTHASTRRELVEAPPAGRRRSSMRLGQRAAAT